MKTLIECSAIIADKYHNQIFKQKRKYTGEPYTVHTTQVAKRYSEYFNDDVGTAAGHCHDLFEDCELSPDGLRNEFLGLNPGLDNTQVYEVIGTVIELTDVYDKKRFPELNRQQRKQKECERLTGISLRAKHVKLCDMLSNTNSIVDNDPEFAKIYLAEKLAVLTAIGGRLLKFELFNEVVMQAFDGYKKLGLPFPMLTQ